MYAFLLLHNYYNLGEAISKTFSSLLIQPEMSLCKEDEFHQIHLLQFHGYCF